jgi:hypothetical protein
MSDMNPKNKSGQPMGAAHRQDDRAVLDKKRTKIPDAEVSLRDQVVTKLTAKLRDMGAGQMVVKDWHLANSQRQEWLDKQETYLRDWDEFVESNSEGPFAGSSTLHLPMVFTVCKALHARFLQALLGIDPYFSIKPRTEAYVNRVQGITALMQYTLKDWLNYYCGIEEVVDRWLWDWVTTGCGILKAGWNTEFESYMDVAMEPVNTIEHVPQEDGTTIPRPIQKMKEVEKKVNKMVFTGPTTNDIRPEDLAIIGGKGDPQIADKVIHRDWLNASKLWTLVDQSIFEEDPVRRVIASGDNPVGGSGASNIKQMRSEHSGIVSLDTSADLDKYQILEAHYKMDVDGNGVNSNIVMWVHERTGELLRATYLRRMNKSGRRPFFKIDFYRRADQTYGMGLVEILHPLAVEMDAMHNMRIDFGTLSTMPIGFYRPTSSLEPAKIKLEPGMLIPVDNPATDIVFPQMGNRVTFGYQEEQSLQVIVERLTGMSDLNLGVMSGSQGAARTATGARALLGESNANLDVHLKRMQIGWKGYLKFLLNLLQTRIPNGFAFRVTGEAGDDYWAQVKSADDIEGDYDFEVSANSSNSNAAIQQEVSNQIVQIVSNPLNIQLGIVTPSNVYEALKSQMKAMQVKDFGKFITKPVNHTVALTPEEEANRILRGVSTPVTPEMDHEGYLAYWQTIFSSDELLGQFNEQQTLQLAAQAKQHEKMIEALQAAAGQQANAQQMQMNAQNSQQQVPQGMSPMAGSNPQAGNPGQRPPQ